MDRGEPRKTAVPANSVGGVCGWESSRAPPFPHRKCLMAKKKWQGSKEYKDLQPLRDQVLKVRQFAVATCENPQGAKPGQTKCPF